MFSKDSFGTYDTISINKKEYGFYSLKKLEASGHPRISSLPYSIRILIENLLRNEDGLAVFKDDAAKLANWSAKKVASQEINFTPARVILQDFTGVPAIVDLAAMRDAIKKMGGDPDKINPLQPVELVIDHSVQVDVAGSADALKINSDLEFERNGERYAFLRWGQKAFKNFRVVPPDTGIVHQVNLEYLARVVMEFASPKSGTPILCPDTLVGTDSHTTMINGLGVLGWGVGGIEAEAAMLGQPCTMVVPEVIGFKLTGKLPEGSTATDAVLTVTQMLRQKGVVGKFVEFFGPGAAALSLADRATIANMAPEYGATCGFFPVDEETLNYLRLTGRTAEQVDLISAYLKAQGLFWEKDSPEAEYSDTLALDLSQVLPCLAGPSRPQDRVNLTEVAASFAEKLPSLKPKEAATVEVNSTLTIKDVTYHPKDGDIVIAAITSCTNTSNPSVILAAGLLAKKACEKGLKQKAWVKTSLAPGSQVVQDYLKVSGLLPYLEQLGFNIVGFGCTTCIGNSGPLPLEISQGYKERALVSASVLSGNRNFEGRVHGDVRANYLASPPLVVAYALAGNIQIDITTQPIGVNEQGEKIYLKDIWPTQQEVRDMVHQSISAQMFSKRYNDVFLGDQNWQNIQVGEGKTYDWDAKSTYVQHPPYFENMPKTPGPIEDIRQARVLAMFGDSITTDHISPAGSIKADSPAGTYLQEHAVQPKEFNSYGARRGNHQVMMRGTFANVRIKNLMLDNVEGGFAKYLPTNEQMSLFDAAMKYKEDGTPLVILAGKEYGSGSSRDWAAKGPSLQGIKAVIAESFERIHRSNLVGMGILPLQFEKDQNAQKLGLTGTESFSFENLQTLEPRQTIKVKCQKVDGSVSYISALVRIDTPVEVEYYRHGGILKYVLRQLSQQ